MDVDTRRDYRRGEVAVLPPGAEAGLYPLDGNRVHVVGRLLQIGHGGTVLHLDLGGSLIALALIGGRRLARRGALVGVVVDDLEAWPHDRLDPAG